MYVCTVVPHTTTSRVLATGAVLNLISINANGLRKKKKKLLLGKMLHDLQAGVCVVTETHLREADIKRIRFPQYHVVTHHCRPTPKGTKIGEEC